MYKPTIAQLKRAFAAKGYKLRSGEYELNIIGIRNDSAQPNSFDDTLCVLFKDDYGDETLLCFPATTDPGLYWLLNPMNVNGTAIMCEGQYKKVYKLGLHRGYKALQQVGKIDFVRDNDRDRELDFNAAKKIHEVIYANIHRAAENESSTTVDKWSAGCQVIQKGWQEFIDLCEKSCLVREENSFDYTLLNLRDIIYA
jgi:hypothetical protein